VQDHIKPAARAVLDAIIDEIEAAESPDDSDNDSDAADEAAGDGSSSAALASPSKSLQVRNNSEYTTASKAESQNALHILLYDV